jgi:hypothetical protein
MQCGYTSMPLTSRTRKVSMYTREQLEAMSTGDIVGMVAELTLNPAKEISQDFMKTVKQIVDARDADHDSSESPPVKEDAHFSMTICSAREGADDNAPRQIRISGDAIECPQRTKRDDETDDDYFNSLPSIDCHVNELVHLLTVGRYQILKALSENIHDPEIAQLQSMYDSDRTYHRIVARFGDTEARVQLARRNDPSEASRMTHQLAVALEHAEKEAGEYTQPTMDIRVND